MPLNTILTASNILAAHSYQRVQPQNSGTGLLAVFAGIIDAGFQEATPTLGNIDITPPAGTLYFAIPANNNTMPDIIGQACADYWTLAVGLGAPESDPAVASVSNDAQKIAAPIAANIRSLVTFTYLNPPYQAYVDAMCDEVKTIIWTVTESHGSGFNPKVL